ncbi:MAG TPA: site-specific integrase [Candidatus Alistipes intestinipullorum]|nr:site-specific integrase [Candidatus Alistipes intestinipullorum]
MKHTFRILFYIKRNAPLSDGTVPIMSRITIDGKSVHMSTRLSVDPALWQLNPGRPVGRSTMVERINDQLNRIRRRIEQCYEQLLDKRLAITPQMIKEAYHGGELSGEKLLAFFSRHNEEFYRMVGINRSMSTYCKYRCVYRHLKDFIVSRYGCEDLAFEKINREFLTSFHRYIVSQCGHKKNTVWVYLIAFKHILKLAHSQGHLPSNPFADYKLHSEFVPRSYLTMAEINDLVGLDVPNPKMRLVRDAFLFSCFTGLSYADLCVLSPCHIHHERGGAWIRMSRRKTGTEIAVRLFSIPCDILSSYRSEAPQSPFFMLPGNRQCNLYLEQIMSLAGIRRHITFHCARHTFATTVTLSQGMAIETISRLLGHRDIRTTQIYAKITPAKLDRDMIRLSKQLDSLCRPSQTKYRKYS